MDDRAKDVVKRLEGSEKERLAQLSEWVRIPSVSSSPDHADDVAAAAEWLVGTLSSFGFDEAQLSATPMHPIVTAKWVHAGRDAPTVLVYGHFDVQPTEPLDEWLSPPYELHERDGRIFGRGVADDKGQVMMHLWAIKELIATGELPVNVLVLADGEEEIGSPSLNDFLTDNPWLGAADFAVVSDSPMLGETLPSVGYGLRGLIYVEATLRTAPGDLHSGQFGGAVPNAALEAARLASSFHDAEGRVTIQGFYDAIEDVSQGERNALNDLPFDLDGWMKSIGITASVGEKGFTPLDRTWIRPTVELNGIATGHAGPGPKTIVPSEATLKISCRLVPGQKADRIGQLIMEHMREFVPPYVALQCQYAVSTNAVITPRNHWAVQLALDSVHSGFGKAPFLIRDGGSIPAVSLLQSTLDLPTILLGFGSPDENKHAPNEWISLAHMRAGLETLVDFYSRMGRFDRGS